MSFETRNGLKNAPEVISEGLEIKFLCVCVWGGGECPQTPLQCALPQKVPSHPQIFFKYYFAPSCLFFEMKH